VVPQGNGNGIEQLRNRIGHLRGTPQVAKAEVVVVDVRDVDQHLMFRGGTRN